MAIKTEWRDPNGLTGISCLSSDTKPDAPAGSICWETDTGNRFERDGDTWQPNGTGGAALVKPLGAGGGPLGYAQMTSITTATALTGIPATATVVVIQAEAQNLRFRDDGVSPTGSVGYLIQTGAGGEMIYTGDLSTVELIEDTAGAIANLLYY